MGFVLCFISTFISKQKDFREQLGEAPRNINIYGVCSLLYFHVYFQAKRLSGTTRGSSAKRRIAQFPAGLNHAATKRINKP
mmetsp:Transcript_1189/g.2507  ORF Transcript_1189/g.2507 Transcript_1189/m.2507 type:complete len:81 (-) Transcript_1189:3253-3495(-)